MSILLSIFITISFLALLASNSWMAENSYYFYATQFAVYSIFILYRLRYLSMVFAPSIVMFFFLGISFSLGSYFVPKEFGFLTAYYINELDEIKYHAFITFYYMNVFNILFFASCSLLDKQETIISHQRAIASSQNDIKLFIAFMLLFLVSLKDLFFQFGIQVGLITFILFSISERRRLVKLICSILILAIMLTFNHENKREIIVVLMLISFVYSMSKKTTFKLLSPKIFSYISILVVFFSLVLSASILRGYGKFEATSFIDALILIPDYMALDIFWDSLIDNFEISHTYPSSILPVDYVLSGKLSILAGTTIIKPLFLLIPREVWESKPESMIYIFTETHSPGLFTNLGVSIPISLPGELFSNFHVMALPVFIALVMLLNYCFLLIFNKQINSLKRMLCCSASILFFILVRGSGLDLYIMTLLCALAAIFLLSINKKGVIK
ncbi:hypothetical protein [Nitrincola sp.]|uniref:hypothetical protein n=1 Tax=Nitrincola sp. TaxID=1926584 RepID=UPI003A9340F2